MTGHYPRIYNASRKKVKIFIALALFFLPVLAFSQQFSANVQLNQSGFYPNSPKIAVITSPVSSENFYITSTNLRDTVFSGQLTQPKQSAYSSVKTRLADFSSLTAKGSFVVSVPGLGQSFIFEIQEQVNQPVAIASLKAYYYQRVSMPLEIRYAGKWHRSAGHPDTAVYVHPSAVSKERPAGTIISSPGGWYDAGDYNKYIVNSGITMGTLLSAYEDFSIYFDTLHTNIPESGNGIPDILNEVLYNLRWMLTMQDPNDGGVYNKCTNAVFDGMVLPGVTRARRYVVQKGTAATLDFAAVTAQAARIFRKYKKELPGLEDSCLQASQKAWKWSISNPDLEYNQNKINGQYKPGILTGGYGDRHFEDEKYWAAAELFITTGDAQYYDVVKKHLSDSLSLPSWNQTAMLTCYSLLRFRETLPAGVKNNITPVKEKLISMADRYIHKAAENAFATVMGQSVKDFSWGGNSNAANQGILLINAWLLTGDKKYIDFALSNLDYLMGRNATGYCFITGLGAKSPMHPHHRQSVADGITEPVPGFLTGGPNPGMQDGARYPFTEPELAYTDDAASYASNEIAINWNAPLVYLANAIEALQWKVGYSNKN